MSEMKNPVEAIQYLRQKGYNFADIGREVGCNRSTVMRIARGARVSFELGSKIIAMAGKAKAQKR